MRAEATPCTMHAHHSRRPTQTGQVRKEPTQQEGTAPALANDSVSQAFQQNSEDQLAEMMSTDRTQTGDAGE